MRIKFNQDKLKKALLKEFIPDAVGGAIRGWIGDKPRAQIREFLSTDNALWDSLPDKERRIFLAYAPEDMDWFTLGWVVGEIAKDRPDIASMIMGSPGIQESLERQLGDIKVKLENHTTI